MVDEPACGSSGAKRFSLCLSVPFMHRSMDSVGAYSVAYFSLLVIFGAYFVVRRALGGL